MAVSAFSRERQFAVFGIEDGAPVDQLVNPGGGFMDDHLDDRVVAEAFASGEGIGHMVRKVVNRIEHSRDAALRPGAIGEGEGIFADDDGLQGLWNGEGRSHPGDPSADNEDIGEHVGDAARMKPREIAVGRRHGQDGAGGG